MRLDAGILKFFINHFSLSAEKGFLVWSRGDFRGRKSLGVRPSGFREEANGKFWLKKVQMDRSRQGLFKSGGIVSIRPVDGEIWVNSWV